jgi:hypothetical protein
VNNYNTDSTTGLFVNTLTWTHTSNNFLAMMLIFPRVLYWPHGVTDGGLVHTQPTWLLVKYKLVMGTQQLILNT